MVETRRRARRCRRARAGRSSPRPNAVSFAHVADASVTQPAGHDLAAIDRTLDALGHVAQRHGGTLRRLADGSALILLATSGPPTDLAASSGALRLALQAVLPAAAVAVVTGAEVVPLGSPIGALIDRAVALLDRAERGGFANRRADRERRFDARFVMIPAETGFELQGECEIAESVRTLLGKPTRCVGRACDPALEASFAGCVEESAARVILITAPAGAGKSRLRYEFVRRPESREDPPRIWLAAAIR